MSYSLIFTTQFKKDSKKYFKNPKKFKKIRECLILLEKGGADAIPGNMKPHKLSGNWAGCWECHIEGDLLIIWQQDDNQNEVYIVRLGSHSELFK
jgi:mRNA interferase YafQ